MDFTFVIDGKKVVLCGMENEGPKEVFAHRMEAIFQRDDVHGLRIVLSRWNL